MRYVVVGGGPCGIFSALLLALTGHEVTLFERGDVLGGCHRVDREGGRFSEHGPRIYVTNYLYYAALLRLCGLEFDRMYTAYKHDFVVGVSGMVRECSVPELLRMGGLFLLFLADPDRFKHVSVEQSFRGFSDRAMRYVDKICTLTDGARAGAYTTYQFFSLMDQNALYEIVEPVRANDRALWPAVSATLERHGVRIVHTAVDRILEHAGRAAGVETAHGRLLADAVIVTLPPAHAEPLFRNSTDAVANAFVERGAWPAFVKANTYIPYISFSVHFDHRIALPNVWGNGSGDWGVAWIVMSDYFDDTESPTLISATLVDLDTPSSHTGLSANQTRDAGELLREAYRQLAGPLQLVHRPAALILNKAVYYEDGWKTSDLPYMNTPRSAAVSAFGRVSNLYWVGPHNHNNRYAFTSMENVCENVVAFCGSLHPEVHRLIRRQHIVTVSTLLKAALVVLLVVVACWKRKT